MSKFRWRDYQVISYPSSVNSMAERDQERIDRIARENRWDRKLVRQILKTYMSEVRRDLCEHLCAYVHGLGGMACMPEETPADAVMICHKSHVITSCTKVISRAIKRHPELRRMPRKMLISIVEADKMMSIEGWREVIEEEINRRNAAFKRRKDKT